MDIGSIASVRGTEPSNIAPQGDVAQGESWTGPVDKAGWPLGRRRMAGRRTLGRGKPERRQERKRGSEREKGPATTAGRMGI